jgi:hypothetical protein
MIPIQETTLFLPILNECSFITSKELTQQIIIVKIFTHPVSIAFQNVRFYLKHYISDYEIYKNERPAIASLSPSTQDSSCNLFTKKYLSAQKTNHITRKNLYNTHRR